MVAMRARETTTRAAWLVAVCVLIGVVAACVPPAAVTQVPAGQGSRPGDDAGRGHTAACDVPAAGSGFERSAPEQVAIDPDAVRASIDYSTARGANVTQVYRHGCLIGSGGLDGAARWSQLPVWSVTKGLVSVITGRAVTLGHLSVDDTVGTYIDGLGDLQSGLTVRQLLNQTTGLRFAWVNDLNDAATGDSARRVLARGFEAEPGSRFIYAQTTVTALVAVLEAAVGEDIQAFAARELFEPIGIGRSAWSWERDHSGRSHGFAGISITPEGLGRIGALLLAGGEWDGEQLIDPAYLREATTGTDANPGYGFLWWSNRSEVHRTSGYHDDDWLQRRWIRAAPADMFGMSGLFNQNLFVIPSLDMVVVRMGLPQELFADPMGQIKGHDPAWDHRFFSLLLRGVRDVEVPEPEAWEKDPEVPFIDLPHLVFIDALDSLVVLPERG